MGGNEDTLSSTPDELGAWLQSEAIQHFEKCEVWDDNLDQFVFVEIQYKTDFSYRIADIINGPFSETVKTMDEAEKLLQEYIEEGQEINERETPEGFKIPDASDFFYIVDADTGDAI